MYWNIDFIVLINFLIFQKKSYFIIKKVAPFNIFTFFFLNKKLCLHLKNKESIKSYHQLNQ